MLTAPGTLARSEMAIETDRDYTQPLKALNIPARF